jgi:hypothetical protein
VTLRPGIELPSKEVEDPDRESAQGASETA